jgi:hypothetical protein
MIKTGDRPMEEEGDDQEVGQKGKTWWRCGQSMIGKGLEIVLGKFDSCMSHFFYFSSVYFFR